MTPKRITTLLLLVTLPVLIGWGVVAAKIDYTASSIEENVKLLYDLQRTTGGRPGWLDRRVLRDPRVVRKLYGELLRYSPIELKLSYGKVIVVAFSGRQPTRTGSTEVYAVTTREHSLEAGMYASSLGPLIDPERVNLSHLLAFAPKSEVTLRGVDLVPPPEVETLNRRIPTKAPLIRVAPRRIDELPKAVIPQFLDRSDAAPAFVLVCTRIDKP
ncbi:MAG: hypothetical protein AAF517_00050 [Planctomycetota bacterium]